jgi:hypothetical protein
VADELLDAVRRLIDDHEQHDRSHEPELTMAADQMMLCALQVRALVQSDSVNTLGVLDAALTGIDERARLDEHTVKLCVDVAAIALHIASRVQR